MEKLCQSCGMPMTKKEEFGTNKDGTLNSEYCVYCFQKGEFTKDCTMEQEIENNLKYLDEFNKTSDTTFNEEQARKEMLEFFPTLKRWKK